MSTKFRNAYHFIPRKEPLVAWPSYPPAAGFGKTAETEKFGHAVYAPGTLSGRIRCRVRLEQPTVIGADRHVGGQAHPDHYAVVAPFTFDGRPAIPAASLKGLISSIAEAASQSTYRVLKDAALTVGEIVGARSVHKETLGTVYQYVPDGLRPGRYASMADRLFGFVRDGVAPAGQLQALAGRVRISHGTLDLNPVNAPDAVYEDADPSFPPTSYEAFEGELAKDTTRLKELAQPMKPWTVYHNATPNMYFKDRTGASTDHISKDAFSQTPVTPQTPPAYVVQGQKVYLHHLYKPETPDEQPWKSRTAINDDREVKINRATREKSSDAGRKSLVRPLRRNLEFDFEIKFDNLASDELDLLCFALRPTAAFRHKIGYGKPLGLGSVEVTPVALDYVERGERYKSADVFSASRFALPNVLDDTPAARSTRHRLWLEGADPAALNAITLLGETHAFGGGNHDGVPVLWVPLTDQKYAKMLEGSGDAEGKSFRWFAKTETKKKAIYRLKPIEDGMTSIPTLQTIDHEEKTAPPPATPHASDIAAPMESPRILFEGDRVEYRIGTGKDGKLQAIDVRVIRPANSAR